MSRKHPRHAQPQPIHRSQKPNPPANKMHTVGLELRNRLRHLPPRILPRRILQRKVLHIGKLRRQPINRASRNHIQFTNLLHQPEQIPSEPPPSPNPVSPLTNKIRKSKPQFRVRGLTPQFNFSA